MRVLGRIRLSRLTEESTSAARQRELIENWAQANEHEIVGWAEDLDVSGSIDPFEAPALKPWWEREADWDIMCAWKLDRIGRRAIPLNRVFGWMIDHKKTLVCVSDNIDLSTWVGRLVANVIAGVAEGELEAIRERTKASRRKLLESGRWPGGAAPYGLQAQPLDGGGWTLALDRETAPVVRRIAQEVTDGHAVLAVAEGLNKDGVPAPRGGRWRVKSIWQIVTAKYLLGHATYDRQTVRDRQGKPVLNAEPILSQSEWDELQRAVASRRNSPSRTRSASPLLGVALCLECGKPLHLRVHTKPSNVYRYYYCPNKHGRSMAADIVEKLVFDTFLEEHGKDRVMERVYIPAEDHQNELEDAIRAVEELTPLVGTMTSATMRSRLTEQLRALDFEIARLETMPNRPAGWESKETETTFDSVWDNSSPEEKRKLIIDAGISARLIKEEDEIDFYIVTQKIPPPEGEGILLKQRTV